MQDFLTDEVIDSPPRLERRVELYQWFRPESLTVEDISDELIDPWIANLDEAASIGLVISDEAISGIEYIQGVHSRRAALLLWMAGIITNVAAAVNGYPW